jgi:hypothetical protein
MSKKLLKLGAAVMIVALSVVVLISADSDMDCPGGMVPTCPFPDLAYSVFFPHPNDCHYFFHCSNGVAYCKKCPAGLHWNTVLDTCDYPYSAGCISKP